VDERLQIKTTSGGKDVYGNLKDDVDASNSLERIQDWLMDPVACPTTWATLLSIRRENPQYGHAPAAAA
jgi:hypothetical protein